MFYFEDFYGQKILKSDYLNNVQAFFTTRNKFGIFPFKIKDLIMPVQTHSSNVDIVCKKSEYPNTDALILTNFQNTIALKFADCTPIILYDEINNKGAVVHAGWRGTAAKIALKTLKKMQSICGTKPENVIALVGPAIGICCYEVSDGVKTQLLSTVSDTEGLYFDKNVDLKQINARQLHEAGVKKIDICPYCTSCDNDLFYSYRKENGTQNRHYAVLNLRNIL